MQADAEKTVRFEESKGRCYVEWRNRLLKKSGREVRKISGNIWLEILIHVRQPRNKIRAG